MYALGDPLQPAHQLAEPSSRPNAGSGSYQQRPMQDFRKRNVLDYRYGPNQVAAVEQNQGAAQRPRVDGLKQWPPRNDYPKKPLDGQKRWQNREKYTFEQMLDRPCSHHSQLLGRPSDHTNRQCAWNIRIAKGDGMLPPPPPRPPQLTGANALPVNPRPAAPKNVQQ